MENAVAVHMVDGFEQLVHVVFDPAFGEVVLAPFDCFVGVSVHQFEDERQSACWLVAGS